MILKFSRIFSRFPIFSTMKIKDLTYYTIEHPNSHIFVRPKSHDYLGMCDCLRTL